LSQEEANLLASFLLQQEGLQTKEMMNRKIVKHLLEKCVGSSSYSIYSESDEKHYLQEVQNKLKNN